MRLVHILQFLLLISILLLTTLLGSARADTLGDTIGKIAIDDGGGGGGATPPPPNLGMRNPSAVYCESLGYTYKSIKSDDGDSGICLFSDGTSCEAWAFLEGRCATANNACAKQGLSTITKADGLNGLSQNYAVCVSSNKSSQSVTVMTDLSNKSTTISVSVAQQLGQAAPNSQSLASLPLTFESAASLPTSVDWRTSNLLSPVRDQGSCGSCTAFSTIGAIENTYNTLLTHTNNNLNLSEQFLLAAGNNVPSGRGVNCCGGRNNNNLSNIIYWGGVPDEGCFPYVDGMGCNCANGSCDSASCSYSSGPYCSASAPSGACANDSSRKIAIDGWGPVPTYAYPDYAKSLLNSGYIVAADIGIGDSYGGRFDPAGIYRCNNDSGTNHAVNIVGYNAAGWIVRNSWGKNWANNGYAVVGYGECAIEYNMLYVVPRAANNVKKCSDVISGNTSLINDLKDCPNGLTITGLGSVLDCNGHTISGLGNGTGVGIQFSGSLLPPAGIAVKNCVISDFETGIKLGGGSVSPFLSNNKVFRNIVGIDASNGSTAMLSGNYAYSNFSTGMVLGNSAPFLFADNKSCGNRLDLQCGSGQFTILSTNSLGVAQNCQPGWTPATCPEQPEQPSKWPWVNLSLQDVGNNYIAVSGRISDGGPSPGFEARYLNRDPIADFGGNFNAWWNVALPVALSGTPAPGALLSGLTGPVLPDSAYYITLRQIEPLTGSFNYDERVRLSTTGNLAKNSSFELDAGYNFYPEQSSADHLAGNLIPDGWSISGASVAITSSKKHAGLYSAVLISDGTANRTATWQDIPIIYRHRYHISGKVAAQSLNSTSFGTLLPDCLDGAHNKITNGCGLNISTAQMVKVKGLPFPSTFQEIGNDLVADNSSGKFLRIGCYNSPALDGTPNTYGTVWCDSISVTDITSTQIWSPSG